MTPRRTTVAGLAALEAVPAGRSRGTVVLVAGFTGSKEDFAPVLPLLAGAGWRLVAIDQRGQYESPGTPDPAAYTVSALADDLLAVVDAAGAPVQLVGHSFGGLVSRAAVIRRPAAFSGVVLLGSGPDALIGPRAEVLAAVGPLLDAGGTRAVADGAAALALTDPARPPQSAELRAFLHARHVANDPTGLRAMGEALLGEPDRVEELRATGVPVLVAHGAADDAWTPAVQRQMATRLGAAYEVIGASVHSPATENPAATAAALLRFWG